PSERWRERSTSCACACVCTHVMCFSTRVTFFYQLFVARGPLWPEGQHNTVHQKNDTHQPLPTITANQTQLPHAHQPRPGTLSARTKQQTNHFEQKPRTREGQLIRKARPLCANPEGGRVYPTTLHQSS
ncbi:unnamed protein product, partial [Ectocarpus sp. 6 AP-2014]